MYVVVVVSMQDEDSLYMGLEYCSNGELYTQLQERGPLPMPDAVQYAAEIVDILSYLRCAHSSQLVEIHPKCWLVCSCGCSM